MKQIAFFLPLLLGICPGVTFAQSAYSYSGIATGTDQNGNPVLDIWTVTGGSMNVSGGQFSHTYYAEAYASDPNGNYSSTPDTSYTFSDAAANASVRQDSYLPISSLGNYTI